ncbi:MAG: class I SAM-dependent methyltransferase [bacterium]|nr:class I SAM-dependent methyltransferase [bacterium]
MSPSIAYYDQNSDSFFDRTVNFNMAPIYEKFLPLVPEKGHILDAGCGIGRDAKYFKKQEYKVTLFDASNGMVEKAEKYVGQNVLKLRLQDMEFDKKFEGVWACASLLHVPHDEMRDVFERIHKALKPGGAFYASFKYGNTHVRVNERDFYSMDEEKSKFYTNDLFSPIDLWTTNSNMDRVDPIPEKTWFNLLCRKK